MFCPPRFLPSKGSPVGRKPNESGSARLFLLLGLGAVLALAAGFMLYVLIGSGEGQSEEDGDTAADEATDEDGVARGRRVREPKRVMHPMAVKAMPAQGGGLVASADSVRVLNSQLKEGKKTDEELDETYKGPPMDVTVRGPLKPDGFPLDLYIEMQKMREKISDCYKQSLSTMPNLNGNLVLSLKIVNDGGPVARVETGIEASSTVRDVKLSACVTRRISRMQMPLQLADPQKTYAYPLTMESGKDTSGLKEWEAPPSIEELKKKGLLPKEPGAGEPPTEPGKAEPQPEPEKQPHPEGQEPSTEDHPREPQPREEPKPGPEESR